MGHYACDMRPSWFDSREEQKKRRRAAKKIVENWMGEFDVALSEKAYKELIKLLAPKGDGHAE